MKRDECAPGRHPLMDFLFPKGVRAKKGIPSVCSANRFVLLAAMERAKRYGVPVVIEATANQVDQNGGYTGMTPADFVEFVNALAREADFPRENVILGGDHLGPLTWRKLPEEQAMRNAVELVKAYVRAGFTKIHLDASMRVADDDQTAPFLPETAARRSTVLLSACEEAVAELRQTRPDAVLPVYVIGSEVPFPGGVVGEEKLSVTSPEDMENVIALFSRSFVDAGLADALERVIAVVVQPGVEFGNAEIAEYDRRAAAELMAALGRHPGLVFEGHSTDYQTARALHEMAEDGVVIQKVGPACTFALREGLYALSQIEKLMAEEGEETSRFMETLEAAMLERPGYWKDYYHGSERQQAMERVFGLSDRCRYYLTDAGVERAEEKLLRNLARRPIPLPLLSQFLPEQYRRIRNGELPPTPEAILKDKVGAVLDDYLKN